MNGNRSNWRFFEDKAVSYFLKQGFFILSRNFRSKFGEIDIIMKRNNDIYFVEVRHRGKTSFVNAFESVNKAKMKRIIKTALYYIKTKNFLVSSYDFHFSVCSVNEKEIDVLWDAFTLSDVGLYYSV